MSIPCFLVVLLVSVVWFVEANTVHRVTMAGAGSNDGSSWEHAHAGVQAALAVAEDGDEIWVAEGTYKPTDGLDRAATFLLLDNVALYGGFAGDEDERADRHGSIDNTILSGDLKEDDGADAIGMPANRDDNSYHVVTGSGTDSKALLDGFRVTGGNADGIAPGNLGGGMFNDDGDPTVTHCAFFGNTAGIGGGGMYNKDSAPTVIDCTFEGNSASGPMGPTRGGGMHNVNSSPTVTDCAFVGNAANHGSGMYNAGGNPEVTDCAFAGNSAGGVSVITASVARAVIPGIGAARSAGGGMYNANSSPLVIRCTFSGNEAAVGGGMYNAGGNPEVTDCTFAGNSAHVSSGAVNGVAPALTATALVVTSAGGGMYNDSSSPTVTDCTFGGNSAYLGDPFFPTRTAPALVAETAVMVAAGGGMYNENGSDPTVVDCTFSDNSAGFYGGGMASFDSNPTVRACTFTGNHVYAGTIAIARVTPSSLPSPSVPGPAGGGMYNANSNSMVTECVFSGNLAIHGGGMANDGSHPTVTGCSFTDNSTTDFGLEVTSMAGGGMCNRNGSSAAVTDCTFSGNSADFYGGGMSNESSSPTLANCTFSGNFADFDGGGMSNESSNPTVTNCTFSGNSAGFDGGGMANFDSNPTVTNCTFFNNEALVGGGMDNDESSPTVTNTILARNSPDECSGFVTSGGYNLERRTSCGCTQPTDQQNTDPLLDPLLRDNGGPTLTHGLLPGSPALDVIPWPGAPTTDQRGLPRPYPTGGLADIGAVEMQVAYANGDVNGDGAIDLLDVVLCQQIARGWVTGTAQQREAADVDDDGDVDADDVRILSEYVLGSRTTLP